MKSMFKQIAAFGLYYSGALTMFDKIFSKKGIRILMYHHIDAANFDRQITFLKKHYSIIGLSDAVKRIKSKTIRGNEVVLTIDDGYADIYTDAYPVLKKHGVTATAFLVTHYVGSKEHPWWHVVNEYFNKHKTDVVVKINGHEHTFSTSVDALKFLSICSEKERLRVTNELLDQIDSSNLNKYKMLTWDQVKESSHIIDYQSHSSNHLYLGEVTNDIIHSEIEESKQLLEKKLGRKVTGFCYPYGSYDESTIRAIKKLGFEYGVSSNSGRVKDTEDHFILSRIGVETNLKNNHLRYRISSFKNI